MYFTFVFITAAGIGLVGAAIVNADWPTKVAAVWRHGGRIIREIGVSCIGIGTDE